MCEDANTYHPDFYPNEKIVVSDFSHVRVCSKRILQDQHRHLMCGQIAEEMSKI